MLKRKFERILIPFSKTIYKPFKNKGFGFEKKLKGLGFTFCQKHLTSAPILALVFTITTGNST